MKKINHLKRFLRCYLNTGSKAALHTARYQIHKYQIKPEHLSRPGVFVDPRRGGLSLGHVAGLLRESEAQQARGRIGDTHALPYFDPGGPDSDMSVAFRETTELHSFRRMA